MNIKHGIIFLGFLALLLTELKITGLLMLPWAVVLAPLWVPAAFVALILNLFATGCYVVITVLKALASHEGRKVNPPSSRLGKRRIPVSFAHQKVQQA